MGMLLDRQRICRYTCVCKFTGIFVQALVRNQAEETGYQHQALAYNNQSKYLFVCYILQPLEIVLFMVNQGLGLLFCKLSARA